MIMMGDRRKAVTAILGPLPSEKKEEDGPDALSVMAEELIDAIHAKDAGALAAGLRAMFESLSHSPETD